MTAHVPWPRRCPDDPHPNLVAMPSPLSLHLPQRPQDQQPRYRINVNASSGVVTWSTRLVGTWYAPLDFRAYPFDHQHILMELALAGSQSGRAALKWQHVAQLNNTAHTKGGAGRGMALANCGNWVGAAAWSIVHVMRDAQLTLQTVWPTGPDLSGWHIKWGKAKLYESRNCYKEYNIAEPR